MAQMQTVHFNLNGKDVERTVDVRASLTDMLRNDYRLTSVKKGCEVGECGACTVLIDGVATDTCLYLTDWAQGKEILTVEGLQAPDGKPIRLCYAKPVRIGNDCWFGANVTVCPGVTIGDGCVIGAGSVVTRDIPAGSLAAGVPCKVLRPITAEDSMANKPDILGPYSVLPEE